MLKKALCFILALTFICLCFTACSENNKTYEEIAESYFQKKKSDEELISARIDAFLTAFNTGDFDGVLACMDAKSRNQCQALANMLEGIKLGFSAGGVSVSGSLNMADLFGFSIGSISKDDLMNMETVELKIQDGKYATLYTNLSYSVDIGSPEGNIKFELKKENGDWFISDMLPYDVSEMEDDTPSSEDDENPEQSNGNVFEQYNVSEIGPFYNGLAWFKTNVSTGTYSSQDLCGYMDIKGNVVIKPSLREAVNFSYDCITTRYYDIASAESNYVIMDKTGKIHFEKGKQGIIEIGTVSEGYFYLETVSEELSGNVYTVKYYSASDLSVVATFNNTKANSYDSTLDSKGNATVHPQKGNSIKFNISEYVPNYIPSDNSTWSVNLNEIPEFESAYVNDNYISDSDNTLGQIATVKLNNGDYVYFYSIVDSNGNVLLKPQRDIILSTTYYFRKDLCPAKDANTGKWGYIDPQGNWKIQPQYSKVANFTPDGYATIENGTKVINTKGEIVLSVK